MPYELFLALRYLSVRRARRGAARVTALAAVAGIACGVAALVFATALANGFREELRDKILRGTAHLTLARDGASPSQTDSPGSTDARRVVERVRGVEGVVEAAATSYTGALLSGPNGTAYTVLRGLDPEAPRAVAEVRRSIVQGSVESIFQEESRGGFDAPARMKEEANAPEGEPRALRPGRDAAARGPGEAADDSRAKADDPVPAGDEPDATAEEALTLFGLPDGAAGLTGDEDAPPAPVVVGAELAARAGLLRVGDEGWIVVGEKTADAPGVRPRARRVRLAGLFRSGLYDYDSSWTYVPLALAASLEDGDAARSGGGDARARASVVSVEVADIYATPEVAERVRRAVGDGWTAVDWREANRPLFAALELERRTVAIIIGLIMVVAALNITATLVLVVVERRADIAVLGAMGAEPRGVMTIFMLEGALVGAAGALAGVALGLAACFVADRFGLVSLPPDVYSLASVPLRPRAGEVALTALAAFLVSLLATVYPARAAARLRPAELLRRE